MKFIKCVKCVKCNVLRDRQIRMLVALASTAAVMTTMAACSSGDGGSPMSPSPSANVPTVTVTATGVSPKEVRIGIGGQVRFVNNDSVNRQINSNPFPAHDDCPPLNDVGLLTPGRSKMSGILSLQGACGFHEHLSEGAQEFLGMVLVGNASPNSDPPIGY